MRDWFLKFSLKLLHSFARAIEIKPFLKIDPDEYCPACGDRDGKITAVALSPEDRGSKVGIQHTCATCSYRWIESSVSVIKNHLLEELPIDEEQQAIEILQNDKRTRNVRSKVIVNGSPLS